MDALPAKVPEVVPREHSPLFMLPEAAFRIQSPGRVLNGYGSSSPRPCPPPLDPGLPPEPGPGPLKGGLWRNAGLCEASGEGGVCFPPAGSASPALGGDFHRWFLHALDQHQANVQELLHRNQRALAEQVAKLVVAEVRGSCLRASSSQCLLRPVPVLEPVPVPEPVLEPVPASEPSETGGGEDQDSPQSQTVMAGTGTPKHRPSLLRRNVATQIFDMPREEGTGAMNWEIWRDPKKFVSGPLHVIMGSVIMLNTAVMLAELQWRGNEADLALGLSVGSPLLWNESPAGSDAGQSFFDATDAFFLACYFLELAVRIVVLRCASVYDGGVVWSTLIDALLIVAGVLEAAFRGSITISVLRLIARPMKFVKVIRVIRVMSMFRQLRILAKTMVASMGALFWSMVLLCTAQLIGAMFLCSLLHGFVMDESQDLTWRLWVNRYYGTGLKAFYTMFEVTQSGGWPTYARPLVEHVDPWWSIFFMLYVTVVVFAIMRIITAIFIKETLGVAADDAMEAVHERMSSQAKYQKMLHQMFEAADCSGDGHLSRDEFREALSHPAAKHYLSHLELHVHEVDDLFDLLDSGNDQVSYNEFVKGVLRLKGQARSMDVVAIMHDSVEIKGKRPTGLWCRETAAIISTIKITFAEQGTITLSKGASLPVPFIHTAEASSKFLAKSHPLLEGPSLCACTSTGLMQCWPQGIGDYAKLTCFMLQLWGFNWSERGGLCVSDVVQVSDMVEAGRATASDLFSIFGYTVNKVVVGSRANCDFHICTAAEATPAGAPLLVLPLSRCWTASSAEATQDTSNLAQAGQAHPDTESDSCVKAECPNLGPALARAADRRKTGRTQTTGAAKEPPAGAESLLEAGSTRIALQLLWELRRQRAGASPSSEDDSVVSARRRASAPGRAVHLQLLGTPGLVAGHAGGSPMPRAPGLVRVSRLETLLAWGRRDLDALRGSPWFDEATRRQAEVVFELRSLLAELGPQVAAELGLLSSDAPSSEASDKFGELSRGTLECFAWARQVLQQYGLTFLLPPGHAAGSQLQLLAPGLELLRPVGPETEARCQEGPDVAVLRLELGLRGGPALVLYAGRSLEEGDPIHFSHGACSQGGFRLLRGLGACGPEVKPWDAVEVLLRLPVHSKDTAPGAQLWEVLQALQDGLSSSEPGASSSQLPGDCLPPNTSESCHEASRLVSVHAQRPAASSAAAAGDPEVVVRVPLRRGHLPCKAALVQLGLLICAHPDRMQRVLREEKGVVNPLGPDACERRALAYLGKRVQWALEEYPSCPGAAAEELECTWRSEQIATSTSLSTKAGDLGEGGEFRHGVVNRQLPPRRLRALWLVATERQLLVEAAAAIQHRLSSATSQVAGKLSGQGEEGEAPHELPGFGRSSRTVLAPRLLSGLLVPGSKSQELSQLLARLQGCTRAAANLGRRFRELHGRDEDDVDAREEGDALQRELLVVSQLLSSSPLGDPLAPEVALQRGVVPAADGTVRAQGQALETLLRASLASLKWAQQCAGSELGVAESESSENANEQLCDVLLLSAATHMRLGDLDAASTELREALAKCSAETRTCRLQAFSEAVVELDISQLTWPPVRKPEANSISSGPEASSSSSSSSFSARCSLPGVDQVALAMARKCAAGLAARSERVLYL
ncbi:unnamed protein product, partial [Polarella glacialis]